MIRLKEAVIVEGKYDKIKLSSLLDAVIITTDGFGIFQNPEKMKLIRRLADETGIIVLTDSDSAGFMIRAKLSSCIAPEKIKHAYIPDVFGKERRKKEGGKEGKLGVEGMSAGVLLAALRRAGAQGLSEGSMPREAITKTDFYEAGLTGGENSAQKRQCLLRLLELPANLPVNSLIKVLNSLMDREEFQKLAGSLHNAGQGEAE